MYPSGILMMTPLGHCGCLQHCPGGGSSRWQIDGRVSQFRHLEYKKRSKKSILHHNANMPILKQTSGIRGVITFHTLAL